METEDTGKTERVMDPGPGDLLIQSYSKKAHTKL